MVRTLVLFLLIVSGTSSLYATDELSTQIATFNDEVKNALTPDYVNNCHQPEALTQKATTHYSPGALKKTTVYSKLNKKTIELSVLSEDQASKVFEELKNDPVNSFRYTKEGCFARAQRMAMLMDEMGIVSGKAFVEGDNLIVETKTMATNEWGFHVASLVMIKVGKKTVPSVFDPSLFDKPVSYVEWKKRLLEDSRSTFVSEYFTKRFNTYTEDRDKNLTEYKASEVKDLIPMLTTYNKQYEGLKQMYPGDYP